MQTGYTLRVYMGSDSMPYTTPPLVCDKHKKEKMVMRRRGRVGLGAWRQGKGLIRRQAPLSPHSQPLQPNRASSHAFPPPPSPPCLCLSTRMRKSKMLQGVIYIFGGGNLYSPPPLNKDDKNKTKMLRGWGLKVRGG